MYKVRFDGFFEDSPYKDGEFIIGNIYDVLQDPEDDDLRIMDETGVSMWERKKSFTKVENNQ